MAICICEVCGASFRAGVGRPPRTCPTHRGIKLAPKNEPTTVNTTAEPADPFTTSTPTPSANKFKGHCKVCGDSVEAYDGYRVKPINPGAWDVFHKGCWNNLQVPTTNEPEPSPIHSEPVSPSSVTLTDDDVRKMVAESINEGLQAVDNRINAANRLIESNLSEDRIKALIRQAGVQRHELTINNEPVAMPDVHHHLLPELIRLISAGVPGKRLNIFMPGPAGSGKSTMAMQAAETLNLPFASLSLGPMTQPHKFFGFIDAAGNNVETDFHRIYCAEHGTGGVFLIDEMDNGHAGLTAELNQALANPCAAFAWGMCPKHPEVRVLASGNTFGRGPDRKFVGRNQLDAATLDRFVMLETPIDETMEMRAAMAYSTPENADLVTRWIEHVQKVREKVNQTELLIVVSPRASIDGAMMLSAGCDWDFVVNTRLVPGIKDEIAKQIGAK